MYIKNENIVADGVSSEFTLDNPIKSGTIEVLYNNVLFYEFREDSTNNDKLVFDFPPAASDKILVSYYTINTPAVGNATRYASVNQVKNTSSLDFSSTTDDAIERYIRDVERLVDSIVGSYVPAQDTQKLQFPRLEDKERNDERGIAEYAPIPEDITRGVIYAVENVHLAGTQTKAEDGSNITSEKLGDYSYSKEGGIGSSNELDFAKQQIGSKAASLIYKYIRRFGNSRVTTPVVDGNLNSRQKWVNKNA